MGAVTLAGFALGGNTTTVDSNGCTWWTEAVTGWEDGDTTLSIQQRPRADGGWPSESFRASKTVTAVSNVEGPSTQAVSASLDLFYAACVGAPTLTVDDGQGPRSMVVRKQYGAHVQWIGPTACEVSWQMEAADPRKYGSTVIQSTALPSSTGGLTWPVTFPVTWTGVTNSGNVSIPNLGNTAAPVTIRIDGPVTGPIITHTSSVGTQVFSLSLTLAAGEFLLIDMENRTVLANGQSSRAAYVTSRGWCSADPGANQYGFNAQTYNSSALMTVNVPSGTWS